MKRFTTGTIITGTLLISAGILMSFYNVTTSEKTKDPKSKKYEVIHFENGHMTTFDTIIPMNSDYTVEHFLEAHHIQPKELEIIVLNDIIGSTEEQVVVKSKIRKEHRIQNDDQNYEEQVEITVDVDENGHETITKKVNGKEVEITPEEMAEIKALENSSNHSDQNVFINVDIDGLDSLNSELKEVMKQIEVEMTALKDLNLDSLLQHLNVEINEEMMENGNAKVIVKKIENSGGENNTEKQVVISSENQFEWNSEDGENHIQVSSTDKNENVTIVLVTENISDEKSKKSEMITLPAMDFTIYPNPSDGNFKLKFIQEESSPTTITILDVNGKVVYSEDLGTFKGSYNNTINLKPFGKGVYIININAENAKSTGRVIIQ